MGFSCDSIDRETIMTEQEFENIYTAVRAKLIAITRQFNRATALNLDHEDIVQEALIAFWELSERGYPIGNYEALLVKITKNICVSRYRKQKFKTEPIVRDIYMGEERASHITDRMDEVVIKKRLYESLTKTEREYMLMKTERGMSLDEISKETGKPKPGIKTALSKAKRKLEEQLKNHGYDKQ